MFSYSSQFQLGENIDASLCGIVVACHFLLERTFFKTYSEISPVAQDNQKKPICSKQFFRRYIQQNHYYPSIVEWADNFTSFQPLACEIVPANIPNCLQKSQIRSIGVLGDSQGKRYALSLQTKLKKAGIACTTIEHEHHGDGKANVNYFARGNQTLRIKTVMGDSYKCNRCASFRSQCQLPGELQKTLRIEYISADLFPAQRHISLGSSNITYEEILFDSYLGNHFPDFNLFFIPMNHLKKYSAANFRDHFEHSLSILKKRKPARSEVYLLPGTAEFESPRVPKSRYKYKRFFGLLALDQIHVLNQNMFSMLKRDIIEHTTSKIYSFLDLVNVTSSLVTLSNDGVHFQPVWYDVLIEAIMGVHCQN